MIVIHGDVAIAPLVRLARYFRKRIPDAQSLSIDVPGTLHLVGRGGGAPEKVLRKRFQTLMDHIGRREVSPPCLNEAAGFPFLGRQGGQGKMKPDPSAEKQYSKVASPLRFICWSCISARD